METGVLLSSQTFTLHIPHRNIWSPLGSLKGARETPCVSSRCGSRGPTSVASLGIPGAPPKPVTLPASRLSLLGEDAPCPTFFQHCSGVLSPRCFTLFQREVLALISPQITSYYGLNHVPQNSYVETLNPQYLQLVLLRMSLRLK